MDEDGKPRPSSEHETTPPTGPPFEGVLLPALRHLTLRCLELFVAAPAPNPPPPQQQQQQTIGAQRRPSAPLSLVMPGLEHLVLSPQYLPEPGAAMDVISGMENDHAAPGSTHVPMVPCDVFVFERIPWLSPRSW